MENTTQVNPICAKNNTLITIVLEPCGSSKSADKVKLQMIYKEIVGAFTCTKIND